MKEGGILKKYSGIIVGSLLIIYSLMVNMLSSTNVSFSGIILLIGAILIGCHFIKRKVISKRIIKGIKVLFCIGLIVVSIVACLIVAYPKKNTQSSDYIIVLGAGLSDGNQLSLILKDRLDAALECLNDKDSRGYIVVSGGRGADEKLSEAAVMKAYLIDKGIEENRIIVEDKSTNTFENFKFSKEKIEESSGKPISESTIKIVTTDFHAYRSSFIAKRNGYENINCFTSKTVSYLVPVCYFREVVAVFKSRLFDN